jgi:hypothetical protein
LFGALLALSLSLSPSLSLSYAARTTSIRSMSNFLLPHLLTSSLPVSYFLLYTLRPAHGTRHTAPDAPLIDFRSPAVSASGNGAIVDEECSEALGGGLWVQGGEEE